jgi:isopentenyl-diphosphate delta-isomerase
MATEHVILVDENDHEIGVCEKIAAHENGGRLHRAFSVFVFHPDGRLMLQQRALAKYHFGGLWTNTCCSHPRPGETSEAAATRRLQEEMGFVVALREAGTFLYRATDAKTGLTEHEYDHIFVGTFDGEPNLNPGEVMAWEWRTIAEIQCDLTAHPERFTPWFPLALRAAFSHLFAGDGEDGKTERQPDALA